MRRKRKGSSLWKKSTGKFRGYPVATIAIYGPDDQLATKVAVGVVIREGGEVALLERWFTEDIDIRHNLEIAKEIKDFLDKQKVRSVIFTGEIFGCPHEEGVDYPLGASCPECPYWAGRDRFTRERIH